MGELSLEVLPAYSSTCLLSCVCTCEMLCCFQVGATKLDCVYEKEQFAIE